MSLENEISQLVEAFYNFDKDQDGFITIDELKSILMDQGMCISNEEADEAVKEANPDADGYIDYKAFARFLVEACRE
ncbi:calmodulin, putative [Entamoeba dispar SAW760]|uniref:Calmodulin, putative n=1 Tax=Entamoeba dispar (strain ATCC PRA-260 / SAW760) TaxID=370354 RepID=B0EA47_ENTDS|nr:calmodulin, putative [Entamoeba dispar SAW760]EDR28593.1 calmodulin, putative [Entamoeba dispar SAW760]|eukprot:EDR28593.1 calmodulin, putative [Entamoeba dispar SAW760]